MSSSTYTAFSYTCHAFIYNFHVSVASWIVDNTFKYKGIACNNAIIWRVYSHKHAHAHAQAQWRDNTGFQKGFAWTSRDNNDCVFDTWAWQDHRWHNETTNHKSPTQMKMFAFLCFMLYSVSWYISIFGRFSRISASFLCVVVCLPISRFSFVCCLFVRSLVVSPFVHCHCTWLNTKPDFKQCLTTNIKWQSAVVAVAVVCVVVKSHFFFHQSQSQCRVRDFIVTFVVCMRHSIMLYIHVFKQICHMFLLHCDWFVYLNQWQNSIFNGDYERLNKCLESLFK